jgi:hypothetical protein
MIITFKIDGCTVHKDGLMMSLTGGRTKEIPYRMVLDALTREPKEENKRLLSLFRCLEFVDSLNVNGIIVEFKDDTKEFVHMWEEQYGTEALPIEMTFQVKDDVATWKIDKWLFTAPVPTFN